MLIDFTAQNFRSIKDTVELSAIAHHTKSSEKTHAETGSVPEEGMGLPYVVPSWNLSLLPVLGIFGANASGKSNVLLAMSTLFGHMSGLPDLTPGVYGGLVPFLLDTSSHLELT